MNNRSAQFIKGIVGEDEALEKDIPQVAFIGRSNVGKSSIINALTHQKDLAKTSSFPGRTTEINLFLVNKSFYLVDLPGYGFAKASKAVRERLRSLIEWYLFESPYQQALVVFIIDAYVGLTESDVNMLRSLEEHDTCIIVIANKVDKIKKSAYEAQLKAIRDAATPHAVIPCSTRKNLGIGELMQEIMRLVRISS